MAGCGQSGVFGRHFLETKNFDKAIGYLTKGLSIEPSNQMLIKDLAHSYLFKGEFNKAIELYRKYLSTGSEPRKSLKDDFDYLRKAGFDHAPIKKASALLQSSNE
jgi:tetratricopeptide (TPR) repeat protein